MKKVVFLSSVIVLSFFFYASSSLAITIGFSPVDQEVAVGSSADVDLVISGLEGLTALAAFDLDISFDASILAFSGLTFGDPVLGDQLDIMGWGSDTGFDDSVAGVVNLFELSYDDPWDLEDFQADSFTLATLTFDTLAAGISSLGVSLYDLSDAWGDPLSATLESGSVTATAPVPEPATIIVIVQPPFISEWQKLRNDLFKSC